MTTEPTTLVPASTLSVWERPTYRPGDGQGLLRTAPTYRIKSQDHERIPSLIGGALVYRNTTKETA